MDIVVNALKCDVIEWMDRNGEVAGFEIVENLATNFHLYA